MEPLEGQMNGSSSPASVSTKLQRIAKLAISGPEGVRRSGNCQGSWRLDDFHAAWFATSFTGFPGLS